MKDTVQDILYEEPRTIVCGRDAYEMIFLRRISDDCWRGEGRSAFLLALILPGESLRCFVSELTAVAELTRSGLAQLGLRTQLLDEIGDEITVFGANILPWASEGSYRKWVSLLPERFVPLGR